MLRHLMVIFVYGTLLRGEANHAQLGPAQYLAEAETAPRYELVDMGHYPALLEGGTDAIRGELYEVPDSWLAHLDVFEDVPTLYERKDIALEGSQALGYVMKREVAGTAPRVASGDWRVR
jgi:gamma-glutamylaminecyclotransferase